MKRNVVILGSTGSIGVSTLDVIGRHPDRFACFGLSANTDWQGMLVQCLAFQPSYAVMADLTASNQLHSALKGHNSATQVLQSVDALSQLASDAQVNVVVSGIVGAAGLLSTLAAVEAGKTVLIANKEPLVMLGDEIVSLAKTTGATLLPLDSEHNAIFQCLPTQLDSHEDNNLLAKGVRRLILTGSGGPFRTKPLSEFAAITPEQACAHPNWDMGKKISVDSSTMMNKGLELIEACALFQLPPEKIEIVIHPQSAIHSMVEYVDGSILSQMGCPDMRIPIAHALGWPDRIESGVPSLDLIALSRLDFSAPDAERFPLLKLSTQAAKQGGTMPTILSAANEVAVEAFLNKQISYTEISRLVDNAMQTIAYSPDRCLESVLDVDEQARQVTMKNVIQLAA